MVKTGELSSSHQNDNRTRDFINKKLCSDIVKCLVGDKIGPG